MNVDIATLCMYYDMSSDARVELKELAHINGVSMELLVESFIISPNHPEAAFPMVNAERFLEEIISDIHITDRLRVSACISVGDKLKVSIEVPKKVILEIIDERS